MPDTVRPGSVFNAIWFLACALWLGAPLVNLIDSRSAAGPLSCPAPVQLGVESRSAFEIACDGTPSGRPMTQTAGLLFGRALDLNRASPRELMSLPRIGPVRASAITRARCRAPFSTLEDLLRVPGIGPKTVEGLRNWTRVGVGVSC